MSQESQQKSCSCCCGGSSSEMSSGSPVGTARGHRLFWALVLGCVLAFPVGWVLATLILLPFLLGLFFYMLFGLLVGAFVFRVASPLIPVARSTAITLGVAVTLVIWCTSLVGEYYNVRGYTIYRYGRDGLGWYAQDGDALRTVRSSLLRRPLDPAEVSELRRRTRESFLDELKTKYPPGGFLGFVRWSAAGKKPIEIQRVLAPSTQELKPKQRGPFWLFRLGLSLVLLGGAVLSQTLSLTVLPKPPTEPEPPNPADSGSPPAGP